MQYLPKLLQIVVIEAEISTTNQEPDIADDNDPFKDLQNETAPLRNVELDLAPENVNAASLVKLTLADSEILARF